MDASSMDLVIANNTNIGANDVSKSGLHLDDFL